MWHPKQLLNDKTIDTLLIGGFTPLQIEFLGWLSWTANSLNHSHNPVKAAHTLLAKDTVIRMAEIFRAKKLETVQPKEVERHPETDAIFSDLETQIDHALVKAQMRATSYEDFTKGGVHNGDEDEHVEEEKVAPVEPDDKEYADA